MSVSPSAKVLVERVSARVFCSQLGGGKPLTIFSSSSKLSTTLRSALARTCEWESVMVNISANTMNFHSPNGDQIDFYAHAALGGSTMLTRGANMSDEVSFLIKGSETRTPYTAILHADNVVSLAIKDRFSGQKVYSPTLRRILREHFALESLELLQVNQFRKLPTFFNARMFGRSKTIVFVNKMDTLNLVRVPQDESLFSQACNAIDSSGIYLYTETDDGHYETRFFPRSSGYPEDPASGAAAASLACTLFLSGIKSIEPGIYRFTQRWKLNHPSVLLVENIGIDKDDGNDIPPTTDREVKLHLVGSVKEDGREKIEFEKDIEM